MQVLLSTTGSRGDVEPLLALAVRLRARDVGVRVCAPPDFAELVAAAGFPMIPAGPPVRASVAGPTPSAADLPRRAIELVADQFTAVAAAAEGCDLVVAAGMMQIAARSIAEVLGIDYVYATYCPAFLPSPHHPPLPLPGVPQPAGVTGNRLLWDSNAHDFHGLFGAAVNDYRASMGLAPVDNVRDHIFTDRPLLAADPVLGPWQTTPELDVVQTGAWVMTDERPLPPDLLAFLQAGAPPVFVGFGSGPVPDDVARIAVETIRGLGRRVLVSRGWAGLDLIDDGADCFGVGEVNQQALFARVAAVVHHGGAGTTTTAALAGTPQVVLPQLVDQPYWAARVADLGIGVAHDGPTPSTASLTAALTTALNPSARTRAAAVAGAIRTDGAAVAAATLVARHELSDR